MGGGDIAHYKGFPPIIIGRGDNVPLVWLYARVEEEWVPFVEESKTTREGFIIATLPEERQLLIYYNRRSLLQARMISDDGCSVVQIDLRPLGVDIAWREGVLQAGDLKMSSMQFNDVECMVNIEENMLLPLKNESTAMPPSLKSDFSDSQTSEGTSPEQKDSITTNLVVMGTHPLLPGLQVFKDVGKEIDCYLRSDFPENISDPKTGMYLLVNDCTVFTLYHFNFTPADLNHGVKAYALLDKSLHAISETLLWYKGHEQIGATSAYLRQIGLSDVKYFAAYHQGELKLFWQNELNTPEHRSVAKSTAMLFPNMVNRTGPTSHPLPYILRRILNALDLINLGFYSEAFISTFALLDDVVQEVIKLRLSQKGFDASAQNDVMMAIKEQRLRHYLTSILKLCDWNSLEVEKPVLFKALMKVNTLRNKTVHNNQTIDKAQCLKSVDVMVNVIEWLQGNPFGYQIPKIPHAYKIIQPTFFNKFGDAGTDTDSPPPIPSK